MDKEWINSLKNWFSENFNNSKAEKFSITNGVFNAVDGIVDTFTLNTYTDPDVQKGYLIYNNVSDTVGMINPLVGTVMRGVGTGVKILDNALGSNVDNFTANKQVLATVGSDFTGATKNITDSEKWSGQRFGLFSTRKKNKVLNRMNTAKLLQTIMSDISKLTTDLNNLVGSMFDYANILRINKLNKAKNGAKLKKPPFIPIIPITPAERPLSLIFDLAEFVSPRFWSRIKESPENYLDLGDNYITHKLAYTTDKDGKTYVYSTIQEDDNGLLKDYDDMALQRALIKNDYLELRSPKEASLFIEHYKEANPEFFNYIPQKFRVKNDSTYQLFLNTLPENLHIEDPNYRMRYAFDNSPDVWTFEDAKDKFIVFDTDTNSWHGSSVFGPTGEFLKSSDHPSILKELDWYNDNENFRREYDLITTDDLGNKLKFYKYVKKSLEFKEGGKIVLKNVIPDGALHKNKHNIEHSEDLTKKGIPVVDNDGLLQAEIEKEELVLILEVTLKLEELKKEYEDESLSQKEKDLIAIKAGKLLVDLIINNTDDKVNLIDKIENDDK